MTHNDIILSALEAVFDNVTAPGGPRNKGHYGICSQYEDAIWAIVDGGEIYDALWGWLKPAMAKWPRFSGDPTFPVPDPRGGLPGAAYVELPLWRGQYGDARLELLAFLIRTRQAELEALNV